MSSSLSNLVGNLSEGFQNKCTDCKSCFEYISVQDDQLIFKCLKCNENYNKYFNKDLINIFARTYEFCNGDFNKFILLLRKHFCLYEYMNTRERFDETSLPNKEDFYSSLNMEGITAVDYRNTEKVFNVMSRNNGTRHIE